MTFAPCTVCRNNRTVEGVCVPCQGNPQAKAKAKAKELPSLREQFPTPKPGGYLDDGPELYALIAAHREGRLQPEDVQLGDLPPHAGAAMRGVAEHMRLLMGLRAAVGDDRPLPYARSMAVGAGFAGDLRRASRVLGALVRAGVVDYAGKTAPRAAPDGTTLAGTKTYTPPGGSP